MDSKILVAMHKLMPRDLFVGVRRGGVIRAAAMGKMIKRRQTPAELTIQFSKDADVCSSERNDEGKCYRE